jgi:23S rRNA G2445 N2-methylase RlmL
MLLANLGMAPSRVNCSLIVTTIPGIEDLVLKESSEKLKVLEFKPRFGKVGGRVLLKISEEELKKIFELRSIEHVIRLLKTFQVKASMEGLNQIYREISGLDIPLGSSFRVTSERIGSHDYTSIDVQRAAGQAVVDKYGVKVDLKNPETVIRVDVTHNLCMVGIQLTRIPLHIRYPRIFQHPSALNPIIAYAMLRLAEVKPGDKVLDAFCGGGTIVIEAAQAWSNISLLGLDVSFKSIEGAWKNAESAGVKSKVNFMVGDARRLENFLSEDWRPNKVVSNLPFGIRSGRLKSLPTIYSDFLKSLKPLLAEESKICLLTVHRELLKSAAENLGYSLLEERRVRYGGLISWIILLKSS